MTRYLRWGLALAAAGLVVWGIARYLADQRYSRPDYDIEVVDTDTYTVSIPKGWRRPDYKNPRESRTGFTTSTSAQDAGDPYFVYGALAIEDNGSQSVESVIADWRKGQPNSSVRSSRLGDIEASTWTSQLPTGELTGEDRTFVFMAANGHVYVAHYQLAPRGGYRMRQDYVFGRVLASLKFKP